jgi:nucleoid-associated protein YgaU
MLVALLFRQIAPGPGPAMPGSSDRLVLGEQLQPQVGGPARDRPHGGHDLPLAASSSAREAGQTATILTPMEPGEAPPLLARDYPGDAVPGTSGWGAALGLPGTDRRFVAAQREQPVRRHKIVDGDTLRGLAERYLGSPDRALEIYEANRDLLPSPELLPIGVELRIPPWARPAPPSSGLAPQRPVVPIPPGLAGEG